MYRPNPLPFLLFSCWMSINSHKTIIYDVLKAMKETLTSHRQHNETDRPLFPAEKSWTRAYYDTASGPNKQVFNVNIDFRKRNHFIMQCHPFFTFLMALTYQPLYHVMPKKKGAVFNDDKNQLTSNMRKRDWNNYLMRHYVVIAIRTTQFLTGVFTFLRPSFVLARGTEVRICRSSSEIW